MRTKVGGDESGSGYAKIVGKCTLGGNTEDDEFDTIVGALQDVMLEMEFEEL